MTIVPKIFLLVALLHSIEAFAEPKEPITIGLLAELSGSFSANGEACRQGYEIARQTFAPGDTTGGRKVRFVYGDTKGSAGDGVTEMKRLIEVDHAIAVFTTRSQVGIALNPISAKAHVALGGVVGHPEFVKQNSFAYRFFPSSTREGAMIAKKLLAIGKRKAAIVTLEDEWTASLTHSFIDAFKSGGGAIAFSENIQGDYGDYASIVTRMKAASPDVYFTNLGLPQVGPVIKKMREQGIKNTIVSNYWCNNADVINVVGAQGMEGVVFDTEKTDWPLFMTKLKELFGHSSPIATTYSCYAGLSAFLQVLADAEVDSADRFQEQMTQLTNVKLLDQNLEIKDREAMMELEFHVFKNGKPELLE